MAQQQSNTRERQHTSIREPRRFTVYLHNDDFTTMEFVVRILTGIFSKSSEEAEALMLHIHHSGKAPAGTYTYDVAMSKANKATRLARNEGFPLRLTVEGE